VAGVVIGLRVAPVGFLSRMTTLMPDLVLLGGTAAFLNIQLISLIRSKPSALPSMLTTKACARDVHGVF
jgi:hypothetical protein